MATPRYAFQIRVHLVEIDGFREDLGWHIVRELGYFPSAELALATYTEFLGIVFETFWWLSVEDMAEEIEAVRVIRFNFHRRELTGSFA